MIRTACLAFLALSGVASAAPPTVDIDAAWNACIRQHEYSDWGPVRSSGWESCVAIEKAEDHLNDQRGRVNRAAHDAAIARQIANDHSIVEHVGRQLNEGSR